MPSSNASSNSQPRAWKAYRSQHRQKAHIEAHNNGHDTAVAPTAPELPHHPLVPDNTPELVQDQDQLAELIDELRQAGVVAYDTEFIGEQSYHPQLCLIQVATAHRVTLIDPLADLDLSMFWQLLCEPDMLTIVHAGLQDVEPIHRHSPEGMTPGTVFDTQIAAGFCGLDYPISLTRLVSHFLGGELDQGPKFSQWDNRPLSDVQRLYAANDVRYLLLLHDHLVDLLKEQGNHDAAMQELDRWKDAAIHSGPMPLDKLKARGVSALSRRRRTILTELTLWRDSAARRLDMPPRTVVADDVLVALACACPEKKKQLDDIKGLPRPLKVQFAGELIEVCQQGKQAPLIPAIPRSRKPSDEQKKLVEALWQRVNDIAKQHHIATALLCNRKDVSQYILNAKRRDELAQKLLTGWRGQLLEPVLNQA